MPVHYLMLREMQFVFKKKKNLKKVLRFSAYTRTVEVVFLSHKYSVDKNNIFVKGSPIFCFLETFSLF